MLGAKDVYTSMNDRYYLENFLFLASFCEIKIFAEASQQDRTMSNYWMVNSGGTTVETMLYLDGPKLEMREEIGHTYGIFIGDDRNPMTEETSDRLEDWDAKWDNAVAAPEVQTLRELHESFHKLYREHWS
mgnify:FL=1